MKLKNGYVTHDMGSEQIMVATGDASFPGLVRSNPTAAFIVDCLKQETTKEQIVQAMLDKYEVTEAVAAADVDKILNTLRSISALDE
jgi:hypothetical protein